MLLSPSIEAHSLDFPDFDAFMIWKDKVEKEIMYWNVLCKILMSTNIGITTVTDQVRIHQGDKANGS